MTLNQTLTLYGIPNCDQVKKARTWLTAHQLDVHFHDFKKAGITPEIIQTWLTLVDWQILINRKGTTWRNLSEVERAQVQDERSAIDCMMRNSSVIKRPVLVVQNLQDKKHTDILVGFSEQHYQRLHTQS
jgi:arsenate reductase